MSRHRVSDSSNTTCDDIRSACDDCDNQSFNVTKFSRKEYCPQPHKYDPGVSYFTSVVTPLSNLTPLYSGCTGSLEFRMRRKNKTVTLQWEPFTGTMAASGIAYLTVAQSICNTPPYPISIPIYLEYKSIGKNTHIAIDPNAKSGNIRFYLNTDSSASGIAAGDNIYVHGGSVSWIVD
jgi:hypothetical protein